MPVVVCPRCRAPNDAPPDDTGRYKCNICEHVWMGESALTASQAAPRQRPRTRDPRVSQEYMPDEPGNEAGRALTGRQVNDGDFAPSAQPRQANPAPSEGRADMKPHSDRSHGGVIPPLKVLPSSSPSASSAAEAKDSKAKEPPRPRVTPNTPTVEVDMDLFDRLESEAQVHRSKQNTVAELTFEPASNTPLPGEGRTMACPVCGHSFVAATGAKAQTCPQCHTSFDHASGRFATADVSSGGPDPLIGRNLRGCVIDKKVGEGGMGSVYHARQLSLERSVAIKVLPPDLARNRNFIQRFEREAKSLAKINHPNILHIYDFGEEPQLKLYFMIIEFVDGTDLGEVLNQRTTLPQLEILDLIRQAAAGLEMAAAKGVIHRDIKPDNLMIADNGICKVSDFGLAKGYGEENEVTSVGVRVGTPAFMSPEQCDGVEVDYRSDVYNLGCTAFLCLTGRLPFDGETPFSIMLKHKSDPIPSVRDISPSVDPSVDKLIQRMLAKKPADRCDSWHSIIEEIEQLEVRISGDPNILRKTRGQLKALTSVKDENRVSEPRARPASPMPVKKAPAEIREAAVPGQLPDWLRPVELPKQPPALPTPTAAPARAYSSSSSSSPAPASSASPATPSAQASSHEHRGGLGSASSSSSSGSSHDHRAVGAVAERQEPAGERPNRASKRMNVELDAARERGMRSESESLATSGERLLAAGRFEEAAKEFRKASEISPNSDHAQQLRAKATSARGRGRIRRAFKRMLFLVVVVGLLAAIAWYGTPLAHNLLADREYRTISDVSDEHLRAERLRAFAAQQKPYDWYVNLFKQGYVIAKVDEALATANELDRGVKPQVRVNEPGTALRALEAKYADQSVSLQDVMETAELTIKSTSGRDLDRARELLSLAQVQLSKIHPELQGIEDMRKEGRHREALERAAQFRVAFPRAGALAAGLPLPGKLVIASEDGQAVSDVSIRIDGLPLAGGQGIFCRRGNQETMVDIAAPGYGPVHLVIPADSALAEKSYTVSLRVAPVWTRKFGKPLAAWEKLRYAVDGLYVQRLDGCALLRANDGDLLAGMDPLPGMQGPSYTPLWIEDKGKVLIGCEDGQVRLIDGHTMAVLQVLHRGRAAIHGWMEVNLTYRPGKRARYLVDEVKGVRSLVAMDGQQEWWRYRGLSGKQQPFLAHQGDRVVVIDDSAVHFLEEDGSEAQIIDLPGERVAPVIPLGNGECLLVPTLTSLQCIQLGPRQSPLQVLGDQMLVVAGVAMAATDGPTVALARADRGLDLANWTGERLQPVWHVDCPSAAAVPPAIGENVVVTADEHGYLIAWSLDSGAVVARIAHGVPLVAAPLVRGGLVIVGDVEGTVSAYALPRH